MTADVEQHEPAEHQPKSDDERYAESLAHWVKALRAWKTGTVPQPPWPRPIPKERP